MDFVTSADGTRIAFEVSGTGPPLVLLCGAAYGARAWAAVAGLLAPKRTVYPLDRRGRGASDRADGYRTEHEVEDVAAVLAGIAGPAELFGHSSGALFALRVALSASLRATIGHCPGRRACEASGLATPSLRGDGISGAPVRAMTLYEPPVRVPGGRDAGGVTARLIDGLASGDRDAALATFLTDAVGLDEKLLDPMRRTPFWSAAVALAHTLPYDTCWLGGC